MLLDSEPIVDFSYLIIRSKDLIMACKSHMICSSIIFLTSSITILSYSLCSRQRGLFAVHWIPGKFFALYLIFPLPGILFQLSIIHDFFSHLRFLPQFSAVAVMSNSLQPHWLQHTRPPCPTRTLRACSNSCPSSHWCHPTTLSSVTHFSSCLPSFSASGSFQRSQFFTSGGQSMGASVSALVLPMNIQNWFLWGLTGLISLKSKGHSRVFQHCSSKASVLQHWASL